MSGLILIEKTPEQLEREDIARQVLEAAAARVEAEAGNETYQAAWKRAAKIIRSINLKGLLNDRADTS